MALPPLTDAGELPLGVHRASLREILDQLGVVRRSEKSSPSAWTVSIVLPRRPVIWSASGIRIVRHDKLEPQDVDVFLVMENTFDVSQLAGDGYLLFDHAAAQAHFGASVFWARHRAAWPNEQAARHARPGKTPTPSA